jgi:putative zinc finger/helix-turn-helix YgiT family protein
METRPASEQCPICGGTMDLVRKVRRIDIGQRSARVEDEFYRCRECKEQLYAPGMMDAVMRRAAAKIRDENGLLQPGQVAALREKLGLTPGDFDRLLGFEYSMADGWEDGTIPQEPVEDSLLRVLDAVPGAAQYLAEVHGVELRDEKPKRRRRAA